MGKTSKPKKVQKYKEPDQYGNQTFIIEFENKDNGFYRTQKPDNIQFKVGEEITYEIENKKTEKGKEYSIIKLPKKATPFNSGAKIDPKTQMISFAMSYTKDLIIGGKIDMKNIGTEFNNIYELMTSKL